MAYMNQERKAALAPAVKAICKKYGVKATLSVNHHSTLCLNVKESAIDFIGESGRTYTQINTYWIHDREDGVAKSFLTEVVAAMNNGNHNRSDLMTDYHDVGWYVDINIGQWNKPYILNA